MPLRRRLALLVAVASVATVLSACQPARAGARCRTTDWGRQGEWILQCRSGRWVRALTNADYARILLTPRPSTDAATAPAPAADVPSTTSSTAAPTTSPEAGPTTTTSTTTTPATTTTTTPAASLPPTPPATRLWATGNDTCVTHSDRTATCWGDNNYDQLGTIAPGDTRNWWIGAVGSAPTADEMSPGGLHSCARTGGTVACWGLNYLGALGAGSDEVRSSTPLPVTGLTDAVEVAGGLCARRSNGRIVCWGPNESGQLGNGVALGPGYPQPSTTPVEVLDITNATQITLGAGRACALLADATVRCWGAGFLGDGSLGNASRPVSPTGLTGVARVRTGDDHTCAVLTTGRVRCWGGNDAGQLGDGTTDPRLTPVDMLNITDAVDVAPFGGATCVLRAGGTVWCTGYNVQLALGGGGPTDLATAPRPVPGVDGVVEIAAGAAHVCVRRSVGSVHCWGRNIESQLGRAPSNSGAPGPALGYG